MPLCVDSPVRALDQGPGYNLDLVSQTLNADHCSFRMGELPSTSVIMLYNVYRNAEGQGRSNIFLFRLKKMIFEPSE